ncbi:MAG TPA: YdbH domain-containing protein [Kiloniellales bacterium]|nr:YdbH domain-containing protein [Kiloniellales bacterium]
MRVLRLLLFGLLSLLLALLLVAAGLWGFRDSLATAAFHRWAEAQGLESETESLNLTLRRLEVRGLRLEDARVEQLELRFAPRRLLRGEVDHVLVEGLLLSLDLTGDGPLLGKLQPLIGESDEAATGWRPPLPPELPVLPAVTLEDAQLRLGTQRGPLLLLLNGTLSSAEGEARNNLQLTFAGAGPAGLGVGGEVEAVLLHLRPQELRADLDLDWQEHGSASLRVAADAVQAGEEAILLARLEGAAGELSSFISGVPQVTAGRLDLALDGALQLPPLPYLDVEPPANWLAWLAEQEIAAQLQLAGQALEIPGYVTDATFFGDLATTRGSKGTSLLLEAPLELHVASLGPALTAHLPEVAADRLRAGGSLSLQSLEDLALLDLERDLDPRLATWITLDLADRTHLTTLMEVSVSPALSSAELTLRRLEAHVPAAPMAEQLQLAGSGTFEYLPDLTSGSFDLAVAASEFEALGISASLLELDAPLRLDWLGKQLHLVLQQPGSLAALDLAAPGIEPMETLDVALTSLALELELDEDTRGVLSVAAQSEPPPFVLTGLGVLEVADPRLPMEAQFDGRGLRGGAARLEGSSLYLQQQEMTLTDFELEAPLAADQPLLNLHRARLHSDAVPALFPTLNLTGYLDRELHFALTGRGGNGALDLAVSGQHDVETGGGHASLQLAPLRFTAGGLQPSIFGSPAADIDNAVGQLTASSQLTWSSGGFNGTLRLQAQDLGFTYAGTRLEGIVFDFHLASLRPLRTSQPQRLSIRRIEPGLSPITDATLFLSIESDGSGFPTLRLQQGEASFTGGRIRVVSGQADPGASLYSARVELQQLDLAALMALLGLDELTGSGRISGTIPVELRGATLAVDDGLLQADGPGVVALRSPQARSALAAGGEYVSLMFDALENFHYEALEIGLTKPPTGITRIRLRLLGANPDVLDAQPFDLNINVETDAAPLLEALAESRRLQQGVTEQLWRLVR